MSTPRAVARSFGLAILLLSTGSASVIAQASLEVIDATDAYVGPVVTILDSGSNEDLSRSILFLLDGGGKYALLSATNPDEIESCRASAFDAYYSSPTCSGPPALVALGDSHNCQFFPIVLPDSASTNLWELHRESPVVSLVSGQKSLGGNSYNGDCLPLTPQLKAGYAISLWGTFDFVLPLKVRRNPFIFGDDFSSGNLEAWSNY